MLQCRGLTYARLARNTGGDNDNFRTLKSFLQAIVGWQSSSDFGRCRDVRQISRDTGGVDDIKQPELQYRSDLSSHKTAANLCNVRVDLHELARR